MKKVSIIDVAKAAGVSVSTVSLVLRQKGKISAQTIDKVQSVMAELGYVHNVAAANLRSNTSNLIGLVLHDFSDTFTLKVTSSIVQNLQQRGYMVFLGQPTDQQDSLAECLVSFIRQGVAGVIYLTADTQQNRLPEAISACTLPVVAVSQMPLQSSVPLVMRDNRQASALATQYLIDKGHRNIAYIGGESTCGVREQRLAGYRATLLQNGLLFREELAPACKEETDATRRAARRLLESNSKITALLCHSAHAIIGCLSAISQVGRTVGKDVFLTQQVSVIGFEDMLQINLSSPSFSYVSSASEETGRQAVEAIIARIHQPERPAHNITLTGELITRESG